MTEYTKYSSDRLGRSTLQFKLKWHIDGKFCHTQFVKCRDRFNSINEFNLQEKLRMTVAPQLQPA